MATNYVKEVLYINNNAVSHSLASCWETNSGVGSHHAGMASHATNYIFTHTLEDIVSETAIQQRHFLRALLSAL